VPEADKTSSERFDYWYWPEELDEWVPRIKSLAGQTSEVHLVMNANNQDQGPKNMQLLEERLKLVGGICGRLRNGIKLRAVPSLS